MIEIFSNAIISAVCFSAGVFLGKKDKRIHLPVLGIILLPVAIKIISTHTALLFPPFNWFIGGRNSDTIAARRAR